MKWKPGTGLSAAYFITSECGRWQICKSAGPIYTLAKLGGKHPELIKSGTLEECKARARTESV